MAKNVAIAAAAENVIYRNWRRKTNTSQSLARVGCWDNTVLRYCY